jgi:hypothetical protein
MQIGLVVLALLPASVTAASPCLNPRQGESLLMQVPEVRYAVEARAKLRINDWHYEGQPALSIGRMVMAGGGSFRSLLNNGLVGYFSVDLKNGVVRDVNGDEVTDPKLTRVRRRLLHSSCGA